MHNHKEKTSKIVGFLLNGVNRILAEGTSRTCVSKVGVGHLGGSVS